MAEQNETPDIAADDVEGHFRKTAVDDEGTEDTDDTEGHFRKTAVDDEGTEDTDDTEGHFRKS